MLLCGRFHSERTYLLKRLLFEKTTFQFFYFFQRMINVGKENTFPYLDTKHKYPFIYAEVFLLKLHDLLYIRVCDSILHSDELPSSSSYLQSSTHSGQCDWCDHPSLGADQKQQGHDTICTLIFHCY